MKFDKKIIGYGVAGVLSLAVVLDSWFTVEQGNRTVVLRLGKLNDVAEPGLNFKIPFIDSTRVFEVRTQRLEMQNVVSYSKDIQQSNSTLSINYSVPTANVAGVFEKYGPEYPSRILKPAVLDKYKEVFGRYTAAEIVADRQRIGEEVFRAIADEVKHSGLLVEAVQIENFDFTDEFEKAIEAAVKAKAEVTQAEQVLRRREIEARAIVVQAQANAAAAREKANADAYAIESSGKAHSYRLRVEGEGRAAAIKAQTEALGGPELAVRMRLNDLWDGKLPATMVPGSALPMINVK